MTLPRFAETHEWIRRDSEDRATVGISDHAQQALGDVVFVELPAPGRQVEAGEAVAIVESAKVASDVHAPVAGTILEANDPLLDEPGLVNLDPMGKAWFFTIRPRRAEDIDGLMDEAAYLRQVKSEE